MNREEVDHGCSPEEESEEIEIEKEGQESCAEKEEGHASPESEAQIGSKEKEDRAEKETDQVQETGTEKTVAPEAGTADG